MVSHNLAVARFCGVCSSLCVFNILRRFSQSPSTLALGLISEDTQIFTTFYPAVLFAALVGGVGAGMYAAVLGGIIAWWAFMVPPFAFLLPNIWAGRERANLHYRLFAHRMGSRPLSKPYEAT